jgi:hypothetical protein
MIILRTKSASLPPSTPQIPTQTDDHPKNQVSQSSTINTTDSHPNPNQTDDHPKNQVSQSSSNNTTYSKPN